MNQDDRREFDGIRLRHQNIHVMMGQLEERIEALRVRLDAQPAPTKAIEPVPAPETRREALAPQPPPKTAQPAVPAEPDVAVSTAKAPEQAIARKAVASVPEPPKPPEQAAEIARMATAPKLPMPEMSAPPPPREEASGASSDGAAGPSESFEMQFGSVWLVRIGIVILLTGFVLFGNWAYHKWIPHVGNGGRLSLIVLAGAALGGIGIRLDRKREEMRNYARVLIAGGAATLYFAAYGAHFVERLRVIESPLFGAHLLLLLAGGIVWFASRMRSQPIALLAILLSYYTSAINGIGAFTLFSSLVLTTASVFLLVKHRWLAVTQVSLVGTYASYGWWRLVGEGAQIAAPYWMGPLFLLGYWILFTVAGFLTYRASFTQPQRATFLTVNNAAFFTYAAHAFLHTGWLWAFMLGFGVVLLVLAAIASRKEHADLALDGSFLAQGLALVTAAFAVKYTGSNRAIILAIESAILTAGAPMRHRLIFRIGAVGTGLVSALLCALTIGAHHPRAEVSASFIITVLIFNAWWPKWRSGELARMERSDMSLLYVLTALGLACMTISYEVPNQLQSAAFAIAATACALSIYVLRLPELALTGQWLLFLSVYFAMNHGTRLDVPCILALALSLWWQRQRIVKYFGEAFGYTHAAIGAILAMLWMRGHLPDSGWVTAGTGLAVVFTGLALLTRSRGILFAGLVPLVAAIVQFSWFAVLGTHAIPALAPIGVLALNALVAATIAPSRFGGSEKNWREAARWLGGSGCVLTVCWAFAYIPGEWLPLVTAGVAVGLLGAGRNRAPISVAGIAAAAGSITLVISRLGGEVEWQNWASVLLLGVAWHICERGATSTAFRETRSAACAVLAATTWLLLTKECVDKAFADEARKNFFTMAWSVFALIIFTLGLLLRERAYRLAGLAALGLAIGHIFLVDVWSFPTLRRILSFLVLGLVLLILGFFYNRFKDMIRRWM